MTSLAHFENVAASIELPGEAVIDGASRPSLTGRSFDNVTPRNGTVINRVAECGAADVDAAVAAARRAFPAERAPGNGAPPGPERGRRRCRRRRRPP